MTIYTKNQIETASLNAREILASWTSGQGATGKMSPAFDHVKTGAINNIPVSVDLLTALAEMYIVKSKATSKFYDAIKAGYLSPNHMDEYKEEVKAKTPLVGHYLTADEYLTSCFDMLPALHVPTFDDILTKLSTFKPSMNKTELVALIEAIQALCKPACYTVYDLTVEQLDKYNDLLAKEESINTAINILYPYLEEIKAINDTTIQGIFRPEAGHGETLSRLITEENYKILVTTPVNTKLDASFNVVEPGYILFSIQVVTL
ncbi:MAG: hypothetical protein WC441_05460 [Patescibacteria group bacterium]